MEIKCRAWDSRKKEMIMNPCITDGEYNDCQPDLNKAFKWSSCDKGYGYTYELWTTKTDIVGDDVYAGDIVRVTHGGKTFDAIVYWKDGGFWLYEHKTQVDRGVYDGDVKAETQWSIGMLACSKVIGNIHENPELLT